MKNLFIAAACATLFASMPAFAEEKMAAVECTDAEMTKMNTKIDSMAAGDSKKMAMDESKMAKDSMGTKDMKGCTTHMEGAMKAMDKGMMEKK